MNQDMERRYNVIVIYFSTFSDILEEMQVLYKAEKIVSIPILGRSALEAIATCEILLKAFEKALVENQYSRVDEYIRCLGVIDVEQHLAIYRDLKARLNNKLTDEQKQVTENQLINVTENINELVRQYFNGEITLNLGLSKKAIEKILHELIVKQSYHRFKTKIELVEYALSETNAFGKNGEDLGTGVSMYRDMCLSSHVHISDFLMRGLDGKGKIKEVECCIEMLQVFKKNLAERVIKVAQLLRVK